MGKAPYDFNQVLTEPRLRIVAEALLEVLYDTELELAGPLDDGYTRGTATFGRQRNALIQLCNGGKHSWLKLTHAAMDVTFEIDGVPCRFFSDDPAKPRKPGFFRRNDCDQLFEIQAEAPLLFRFIVAKPQHVDGEAEVFFIGYDVNQNETFRWQYSRSTPTLSSVDDSLPTEVPLPSPTAKVRQKKPEGDVSNDRAVGDDDDSQG
jgi:hypothetical protein